MNIKGIEAETIYYIKTDEPGFEEIVRYAEDMWYVVYSGRELAISNPEELEESFQRILLTNCLNEN